MKKAIRILVCVLLLFLMAAATLCVSYQWAKPNDKEHQLTILTWNTHQLSFAKPVDQNEVVQYLLSQNADILCLQETEVRKNANYLTLGRLRAAMEAQYPYTYFDFKIYNKYRQYGNIVFSKYPLVNKHTIQYSSRANISSCCDVLIGCDTFRLVINHLESNRLEPKDWSDNSTEELRQSVEKISEKLRLAGGLRLEQAKLVKQELQQSKYPVLVVGDLNSLSLSQTYFCLRRGLRDCFLEGSKFRLGNTFYSHHLGIRIDYILCSKYFQTDSCWVDYNAMGSDHYPVIATLVW